MDKSSYFLLFNKSYERDLTVQDDNVKLKLKLAEHRFLYATISQRSRNTWTAGAFFVPISFLIFSYAVTARNLSELDMVLLLLASVSSYSVWLIILFRTETANKIYIEEMKSVEKELTNLNKLKEIGIEFQPLTKTDSKRKGWLGYRFPKYVWVVLWLLLIHLWIVFIVQE